MMVELSLLRNCDRFITRKHASLDKKISITETLSNYHIAMQSFSIRAPHLLVIGLFVCVFIMLYMEKSADKCHTHYRDYRYGKNDILTLRSSPGGVRTNTSCPSLTSSGRKQVNSSTNITSHHPKLLSCTDISNLKLKRYLGQGWTKVAYQSTHNGKDVVVKMISHKTKNIKDCLKRGKYFEKEECYKLQNYKLMKEIMLSLQLDHRNMLKVKVYKTKNSKHRPFGRRLVFTGERLDHLVLKQGLGLLLREV